MNSYLIVACATPNKLWIDFLRGGLKYNNPVSNNILRLNISNLVPPDYNIFSPLEWTINLRRPTLSIT
jgi:hypothetical protein